MSKKFLFGSECSFSRITKSQKAQCAVVNEHIFDECNVENGLYGQTTKVHSIPVL